MRNVSFASCKIEQAQDASWSRIHVRAQNTMASDESSLVVINNTHADKCDLYDVDEECVRLSANCVEDNDVGEASGMPCKAVS